MGSTKIEWASKVWNPISGCSPVSAGCEHCYARRMANRLRGRFGYPADDPFRVTVHPDRFDEPTRWRTPSRIFVCSMGDLFHDDVPDEIQFRVLLTMTKNTQHTFCVLTKRPTRMREILSSWSGWKAPKHIWLGVSVENQPATDERIPILLQTPAALRFVSVEPMLWPVSLALYLPCTMRGRGGPIRDSGGLDWVICGGDTGPGARTMHPDWVRSLRDQCQAAGVPFFFKGHGGRERNRILDGRTWEEVPEAKR